MTTTAEGVETQEQMTCVIAKGCTEVQGFFYSRAVPDSEAAFADPPAQLKDVAKKPSPSSLGSSARKSIAGELSRRRLSECGWSRARVLTLRSRASGYWMESTDKHMRITTVGL